MRQLVEVLDDVHDIDPDAASIVRPFAVCTGRSHIRRRNERRNPTRGNARSPSFTARSSMTTGHEFTATSAPEPVVASVARRTVTGLVDWESASVGPRSIDIAQHCGYNLLHERADAAAVFTRERERLTGRSFHRWADIAVIIGLLDSHRRHPPATQSRFEIEAMLQHAVNEIDSA